jgi:hypothetical protein
MDEFALKISSKKATAKPYTWYLKTIISNVVILTAHWEQISSTGMGTPPAPPWATVFYGIHELQMVPRWQAHVR